MRSRFSFGKSVFVISVCCLAALSFAQSPARESRSSLQTDGERDPLGILVLDGSGVHDVGQLLMHTGNWGAFGSYPSSTTPISQYPSAEWPAGSGVEHLNIAGLWVGGLRSCILCDPGPFVSTAAYEMEFRPTADPIDRIYETNEGAIGGNRLPWPNADDDGDGLIDEDWLDGRDNDGDGLIDEDFAGISQQMFSSWFTDDQPEAAAQYPNHVPLGLTVRQESYQWTDPRFDDFVGASFKVMNTGADSLYDLYTGLFLDFDLGARDVSQYWADDGAGYWEGVRSTELGSASIRMAYMYNAGDSMAPSYIGAMLLGHTVSPGGAGAPASVGLNAFRVFSGDQPFENGGDPTNDFERYEVLSESRIDMNQSVPRDYRVMISAGSFGLEAGESIELHVGFVCGADFDELLDNAARCQTLFDGLWFDIDGDPATGVEGRETQVHWILEGPQTLQAGLDIKPGSCPNPFNVKVFDFLGSGKENKGGVLPVAILGSDEFDVREIDLGTVRLEGVEPLAKGCGYEDVSSQVFGDDECGCTAAGPDGYEDLVLKFNKQRIAAALLQGGLPQSGDEAALVLEGSLMDGTPFEAADCVLFVGPGSDDGCDGDEDDEDEVEKPKAKRTRLLTASPNPFNPATTIRFDLAAPGHVTLAVYDVGGRLVRLLLDRPMAAGLHQAIWDGRSAAGSVSASGVYFYRLTAPGFEETRKMVLMR